MTSFRYTIARLLLAVAVIAFALMALVNASSSWVSVMLSGVAALLLFSVCKAVSSRGSSGAFWISFALCGWGYFYLVFIATASTFFGGTTAPPSVADALLTTRLLVWMYPHIQSREDVVVGSRVSVEWGQSWWPATILEIKGGQYKIHYDDDPASVYDEWVGTARMRSKRPPWEAFRQVGQTIWTVIVALVAGLVARWCSERRDRAPEAHESS